jgi:ferredoxin--NADP+ reductase
MANWLHGKVVENRRLNQYLTSLIIDVSLDSYEAGQFVRIGLQDDDAVIARPYSLVSIPQEPHLEVYFNIVEDGPLSPRLFDLKATDCHPRKFCARPGQTFTDTYAERQSRTTYRHRH